MHFQYGCTPENYFKEKLLTMVVNLDAQGKAIWLLAKFGGVKFRNTAYKFRL